MGRGFSWACSTPRPKQEARLLPSEAGPALCGIDGQSRQAGSISSPQPLEPSDKAAAKTRGEKKGRAPIGAGGDELQLSRAVRALVERHAAGEYTRAKALPEESPFGRSHTLRSERLRQPAGEFKDGKVGDVR